jgi:hypothetical protein
MSLIRALVPLGALLALGCDAPSTKVVLDNRYPPSTENALVVDRAHWQAVSFTTPVAPGSSSDPQSTVPASANTAYVLLAPGWDGASTPASFIVLQSRGGFAVHLDDTLHIPVDDTTFAGNCATGSVLAQADADFITARVFDAELAGRRYDPASCTTSGP